MSIAKEGLQPCIVCESEPAIEKAAHCLGEKGGEEEAADQPANLGGRRQACGQRAFSQSQSRGRHPAIRAARHSADQQTYAISLPTATHQRSTRGCA